MSFADYLFGTIAGGATISTSGITFVPDGKGGTIDIKGRDAIWWGMKNRMMQKKAYEFCYPVASVVDRLAEYDIAGIIEILRTEGKGRENFATNSWSVNMNKLLAQPNPMQSWEQFRGQQVVYKKTFGFCPVLPLVPVGFSPDNAISMVNLPPWCFDPIPTNDYINIMKVEDVVKEYRFTILGKSFMLKPSDVIILEDSFMQDEDCGFVLPQSKLVGLDMAISNICAAMEADNVLLKKRGPLGFISAESQKDAIGALPMDPVEKRKLQEALQTYGLSMAQYQYVISALPAKWNPMSYDVKQLGTKETIVSGEKAICHRYGFPYVLYEEIDATYANSANAAKAVYQNNIIPNSTKDLNKYNKFFKAAENKVKIVSNYEHIAALQEDKLQQANAAKSLDDALSIEYSNNLITKNQWLTARGYDTVSDGDTYKAGAGTDPLAVKLGVGGTQSLIALLENPALNSEAKKNGLVILFGMNEVDAGKLVSEPSNPVV